VRAGVCAGVDADAEERVILRALALVAAVVTGTAVGLYSSYKIVDKLWP
jgi:hypothetical protein